jgi:hypothetical protein
VGGGTTHGAPGNESKRWSVPKGDELAWRIWDDEFLVYSTASGRQIILIFWPEKQYAASMPNRREQMNWCVGSPASRDRGGQRAITDDRPLIRELDELGLIAPSTT